MCQDFPSKIFCLKLPKNFRRGILYCCIDFGYRKSLDKRRGVVSRFSVKNFLSHNAENFRRGTPWCFTNFGCRKMLGINRKKLWQGSDSSPEPTAWKPCCPKPTAAIYFSIKRVGDFGLKKEKHDPTEWIFFLVYYIYGEK